MRLVALSLLLASPLAAQTPDSVKPTPVIRSVTVDSVTVFYTKAAKPDTVKPARPSGVDTTKYGSDSTRYTWWHTGRIDDSTRVVVHASPPPPPPPPPTADRCPTSGRQVKVTTAAQFSAALKDARPGDVIRAIGTYSGKFAITADGTTSQPITLCGAGATINGGSYVSGYALHLNGASYWRIYDLKVTGAQKGVVLDRSHHNVLDGLEVHHVGSELVHLRDNSTNNLVTRSHIHDAGQVGDGHNAEGVYVGSAVNNYPNDQSHDNQVVDNLIEDVGAEGIEAKENVRRTIVRGNVVRRTGNPAGSSPGAIATRGGNGTFECNDVSIGGKVTAIVQVFSGGGAGDGDNNVIRWNKGGKVSIHSSQVGNVAADNTAAGYAAHCQ